MSETMDLFAATVRDLANGPHVATPFQGLTKSLMMRLAEKGLTLEQLSDRRMLNRSVETLKGHCREYCIRFPDYTPSNMRKHITFVPTGDFLNLTGEEAQEVARALGIVVLKSREQQDMCMLPAHGFASAKVDLARHGYVAKIAKVSKRKVKAHA